MDHRVPISRFFQAVHTCTLKREIAITHPVGVVQILAVVQLQQGTTNLWNNTYNTITLLLYVLIVIIYVHRKSDKCANIDMNTRKYYDY